MFQSATLAEVILVSLLPERHPPVLYALCPGTLHDVKPQARVFVSLLAGAKSAGRHHPRHEQSQQAAADGLSWKPVAREPATLLGIKPQT